MSLERWVNQTRVSHPVTFWFGYMLPINLFLIFAGLMGIAWAVKEGWLQ